MRDRSTGGDLALQLQSRETAWTWECQPQVRKAGPCVWLGSGEYGRSCNGCPSALKHILKILASWPKHILVVRYRWLDIGMGIHPTLTMQSCPGHCLILRYRQEMHVLDIQSAIKVGMSEHKTRILDALSLTGWSRPFLMIHWDLEQTLLKTFDHKEWVMVGFFQWLPLVFYRKFWWSLKQGGLARTMDICLWNALA